ncbi:MAG: PTS cellobiose transporter subunit IIC [Bacteroidales bacterium]|nr:PTS cellobiose transporter subunit IIC [Bacteroidales bacterium]
MSCSLGFTVVIPGEGSLNDQILACTEELQKYLAENKIKRTVCIKQSFFVNSTSNEETRKIEELVLQITSDKLNIQVPTSVIPQPPLGTSSRIIAEYTFLSEVENIELKILNNIQYLRLNTSMGVFLTAAGMTTYYDNSNILEQSLRAFEHIDQILNAEGFTFGDIVRQWNYIEGIIDFTDKSQHYQIFNDVRSNFYSASTFPNGYPAATGIGMSYNGVILDFIAFKPKKETKIIPLQNPVQTNAHQYSPHVLSENQFTTISCVKSTPKFERGKAIVANGNGILFVSGTAAIKGELSASQYDAAMQTLMTLQNIDNLTNRNNLIKHGIPSDMKTKLLILRVYIKNSSDYENVHKIVNEYAGNIPVLYLQADICRSELLVEIEGVYELYR